MPEITQLGRYQLEGKIGEGAYAEVYKATDTVLKRTVALKILRPALLADAEAFQRFLQEAQAAASLVHPHIAHVWDLGEADGRYFIAMRYVDGPSLDQVIKTSGPMEWEKALQITCEVADALSYAHRQGLVHREIKLQNILIGKEGAVLTDFGLVKAMQSSGVSTRSGVMVGTPQYMPPEVWNGQPAGPPCDQYALACVLVEMLSGHNPFEAPTPLAVMKKVFDPLVLPQSWPVSVPKGLEEVLRKALAKEPGERYAGVTDFSAALQKLGEKPVPLPPPQPVPEPPAASRQPRKPPESPPAWPDGRKPKWWLVGGAGTIILVVGFIAFFLVVGFTTNWFRGWQTVAPVPVEVTRVVLPTQIAPANSAEPPACIRISQTWTSPKDGMVEVCVPAGEFQMGSDSGNDNEKPVHTVTLDAFWIDQTDVTNAQYAKCVEAGACKDMACSMKESSKADQPAVCVDWFTAKAYCEWAGRRLPTEAKWEKAARGTDGRTYPWGEGIDCNKANYFECKKGDTTAVGSYPAGASPYGALDMAGNAWQWVADWYGGSYYSQSPSSNPQGPSSGDYSVLRSGSWNSNGWNVRTSNRYWNFPVDWVNVNYVGFRCSR